MAKVTAVYPGAPGWVKAGGSGRAQRECGAAAGFALVAAVLAALVDVPVAVTAGGVVIALTAAVGTSWSALARRHRTVRRFSSGRDADDAVVMATSLHHTMLADYAPVVFGAASDLSLQFQSLCSLRCSVKAAVEAAREADARTVAASELAMDLDRFAGRMRESK